MDYDDSRQEWGRDAAGRFVTTHWSVVLAAADEESSIAQNALQQLCHAYWYPLYAYVRRRGYAPEDAQDLTQEFFLRLLRKRSFTTADPNKGRFRAFLLGALKHFLADAQDRAATLKRGGGKPVVSWEQDLAEDRFIREPADEASPDRLFERRWALTVLDRAFARLEQRYRAGGRSELLNELRGYITTDTQRPTYAEAAEKLQMTESAVASAVFRLRQSYHELVREEVAQTVSSPSELDEEIRHLMGLFGSA
jgi:RNA polymerase sigma factor (sigma-70 family)